MAHEIGTTDNLVLTGGKAAWHGLGTVLPDEALDAQQALRYSGLAGWELTKEPTYQMLKDGTYRPVPDRFHVVRGRDERVLGTVGAGYTIVHNEEAFTFMDTLLGGEGFHYKTAGSLRDGKVVWMLAETPFEVDLPDGNIRTNVLLVNSHDGSYAVRAAVTPVRVVCSNTLRFALDSARASYRINHTANAAGRLAEAQAVLGLTKGATERLGQRARALAARRMSRSEFDAFLTVLVPDGDTARTATLAERARAGITQVYLEAEDQRAIVGTAWGAVNAVSAYWEHYKPEQHGKGETGELRRAENHLIRVAVNDPDANSLPMRAMALLGKN